MRVRAVGLLPAAAIRLPIVSLALVVIYSGCAAAPSRNASPEVGTVSRSAGPKRIVAAVLAEPRSLSVAVNSATGTVAVGGLDELEELVMAGLANVDDQGLLRPQLA